MAPLAHTVCLIDDEAAQQVLTVHCAQARPKGVGPHQLLWCRVQQVVSVEVEEEEEVEEVEVEEEEVEEQ